MHYFSYNIGDYRKDAFFLSNTEDYFYRILLENYYLTEEAIPLDLDVVFKSVRAKKITEKRSVQFILHHFFNRTENGFMHKRCEKEIAKYREKSEKCRQAGYLSGIGRLRKSSGLHSGERQTNAERTFNKPPTNNQKPETNNQKPVSDSSPLKREDNSGAFASVSLDTQKKSVLIPPTTRKVWSYMQERGASDPLEANRFCDFYASKGWMVGKNKMRDWRAAVRNWTVRLKRGNEQQTESIENFRKRTIEQGKRVEKILQDLH